MKANWLWTFLLVTGCSSAVGAVPGATAPSPSPSVAQPAPAATPTPLLSEVAAYKLGTAPQQFEFDNKGSAWVVTTDAVVEMTAEGREEKRFDFNGSFFRLHIASDNTLWRSASGDGAYRLGADGKVIQAYPGPSSDWAPTPMTVDRDGNPWVGYDFASKLYKYRADGTRLLDLNVPCRRGLLHDAKGNIVAGSGDRVTWLAPSGAILREQNVGENFREFGIDSEDTVWAVDQDERGSVHRLKTDGTLTTYNPTGARLTHLFVGGEEVWVTSEDTLYALNREGEVLASYPLSGFSLGRGFTSAAYDPRGFIWLGYQTSDRPLSGHALKMVIRRPIEAARP